MRPGICTRTTHTPVLNGTFQGSCRFYVKFFVESGNTNGGFSCIFGRLKVWICKIIAYEGWSIINWCMKGVHEWDWVHKRFLCPRATPSGINNRACTQSHSWTPNFTESPLKIVLQNNRKQRQFFLLRGCISKSIWTSFGSFHNLTFFKCWPF